MGYEHWIGWFACERHVYYLEEWLALGWGRVHFPMVSKAPDAKTPEERDMLHAEARQGT